MAPNFRYSAGRSELASTCHDGTENFNVSTCSVSPAYCRHVLGPVLIVACALGWFGPGQDSLDLTPFAPSVSHLGQSSRAYRRVSSVSGSHDEDGAYVVWLDAV